MNTQTIPQVPFGRILMTLLFLLSITVISCEVFSNEYEEVYQHTDYFVGELETNYYSYGAIGGMEYKKTTQDNRYQILPIGRLINVKILEEAPFSEYEKLRDKLESHYRNDSRVNRVYICNAGTVMIDCRN